jgi:hypothetical protein
MNNKLELTELESKWLDRMNKCMNAYGYGYVCSWWLRVEYDHEGISTAKINYILTKLVGKGVLNKETSRSYTKFSLVV